MRYSMKTITLLLLLLIAATDDMSAQVEALLPNVAVTSSSLTPQVFLLDMPVSSAAAHVSDGIQPCETFDGKNNDPAYGFYKEGYNLILEERWEHARKKFAKIVKNYPQSEYVDDAEYWSAFALRHLDKRKAVEEYEKFILKYPNSNYFDDAFADYQLLNSTRPLSFATVITDDGTRTYIGKGVGGIKADTGGAILHTGRDSMVIDKNGKVRHRTTSYGFNYSFGFAPGAPRARQQMNLAEQRMARKLNSLKAVSLPRPRLARTRPPSPVLYSFSEDKVDGKDREDNKEYDPETKLKMDALYALGDTKEDSLSFTTLRDVAVDPKQPQQLRETAMDVLSNFKKHDVLSVYVDVAKNDTSEYVQNIAIDYIGQLPSDKDKSVAALTDLFSAIPKYRVEKLQSVLWSIGEIGNHRAVNFLSKVAKTHENHTLRSDAIYYLGNIGGEEARQALYDILKGR